MKILPLRALTNINLLTYAQLFNIPHFGGVFMQDNLPKKVKKYERGIINLDSINGSSTHWITYKKLKGYILQQQNLSSCDFRRKCCVACVIGLIDFMTFNTIPYIDKTNK